LEEVLRFSGEELKVAGGGGVDKELVERAELESV
jgi:hypothetical protein